MSLHIVSDGDYGTITKRTSDGRTIRVCGAVKTPGQREALEYAMEGWIAWGRAGSPSHFRVRK